MALGEFLGACKCTVNSTAIPNCLSIEPSRSANVDRAYVDDLHEPLDGGEIDRAPEEWRLRFRDGGNSAGTSAQARDVFVLGSALALVVLTKTGYGGAAADQLDITLAKCRVTSVTTGEENKRGTIDVTLSGHTTDGTTAQSSHAWS